MNAIKERSREAADTISEDVEDILKTEKETLKPQDMEKLNEILEEADDLRLETKD
jgi:hypothetical protein